VPGIYLKHGDAYVPMTEKPYDGESVLQALIAQHPEILADESAGQGPLLLVRREAAVSDQEDGGGRWNLDHLYVDSEGVPTLVEVKRSSDTRGRREVVAQMLDYAANARISFSAERMAAWVEEDARVRGTSAAQALSDTLGVDDLDAFWATVATNLDAERFRLIFVSDVIAPELRRIIEFLNGQMANTVVLAIEVKQYVDDQARHQTIVPRVIGNTEAAKQTKGRRTSARQTDRESLIADLADGPPGAADAARGLLDWGEVHPDLSVRWNRAGDIGLAVGYSGLLRVWAEGTVEFKVNTLRKVDAAWDDDERIEDLLQRLELIDGVVFKGIRRQWPRTPLAPLADASKRRTFLAVIDDVIQGLDIES
jgi:hypothetical protein